MCEHVIGEICGKGCLTSLLYDDPIDLQWNFKCSLVKDLTAVRANVFQSKLLVRFSGFQGMVYLQNSAVASHGNLSSHSCLVDSKFVLKVCDYGLGYFRNEDDLMPIFADEEERDFDSLFWRAPEFLRHKMSPAGSQVGTTASILTCFLPTFVLHCFYSYGYLAIMKRLRLCVASFTQQK